MNEKFLAWACDGAADVIVNEDRRLLKLGVFRGISIVAGHEMEFLPELTPGHTLIILHYSKGSHPPFLS